MTRKEFKSQLLKSLKDFLIKEAPCNKLSKKLEVSFLQKIKIYLIEKEIIQFLHTGISLEEDMVLIFPQEEYPKQWYLLKMMRKLVIKYFNLRKIWLHL